MKFIALTALVLGLSACHETREYKDLNAHQRHEVDVLVTEELEDGDWVVVPRQSSPACAHRAQRAVQVYQQQSAQQACATQVKLEPGAQVGQYQASYYDQGQLVHQTPVQLQSATVDTDARQVEQVQFTMPEAQQEQLAVQQVRVTQREDQSQAQVTLQGQSRPGYRQQTQAQVSQRAVSSLFGRLGSYVELNLGDFLDF